MRKGGNVGQFTIHASDFSSNRITVNIETTLELDAGDVRSKLRRIGGIRITDVKRCGTQWTVTIAHQETNPHPLNVRLWNLLESAYDST